MNLGDTLIKALLEHDADTIGRIAEYLRFGKVQRNYQESYEFICRICRKRGVFPPDLPLWDALLRESEGG
jgi:hypothetical protein